jgi:hypothetical protein
MPGQATHDLSSSIPPDVTPSGRGKLRALFAAWSLAAALLGATAGDALAIDIKMLDDTDGKGAAMLLTGQVVAGDGLKVRSFVAGLPASRPITAQLAFAGGARVDALSIGQFLHQARIRTVVPAKMRCNSPCPLVLVGGRDPLTGKPSYLKYSSASLGFTGVVSNYADKEYTVADLDAAVANAQREILQIADYLHAVGANINMLRYYQSVLKSNEVQYITNEQALDLGIAIFFEETGQVIEPLPVR